MHVDTHTRTRTRTPMSTTKRESAHTERDEGKTLEIISGLCAGRQVKCELKGSRERDFVYREE